MKKYFLLLSIILLSCSGGISKKSLIGDWVNEYGFSVISFDQNNIILIATDPTVDEIKLKYSIEKIDKDLQVIIVKIDILESAQMQGIFESIDNEIDLVELFSVFRIQFIFQDENTALLSMLTNRLQEDFLSDLDIESVEFYRLPDLSKITLFDEIKAPILSYWDNICDEKRIKDINSRCFYWPLIYYHNNINLVLENDSYFFKSYQIENPDFNANTTYLDILNAIKDIEENRNEDGTSDESLWKTETTQIANYLDAVAVKSNRY